MDRPEGLPEPGLHENVPFEDYLTWPAASNSGLGIILGKSPAHYKHDRDADPEESEDTDAQLIGKATHAVVLEPELFGERYRAAGQCSFVTGKNEPCQSQGKYLLTDGRSACGTHVKQVGPSKIMDDLVVLKPNQAKVVNGCSNAVQLHPAASEILRSEGPTEVSLVWDEVVEVDGEEMVVWCKARLDKLAWEFEAIADWKTAQDASKLAFERAIWNFGYHRQGAFYLRGAAVIGIPIQHYVIVAQEKSPPYAVAVYRLSIGALGMGEEYIDAGLKIYARCVERDEWPGYSDGAEDVHLPSWAWRRGDDELYELDPTRGP